MKRFSIMFFLLPAAAWFLLAESARSQPLTAEEILSVMNESFKPAAAACVQGKELPDTAKLTVIIGKYGSAFLESVSPALGTEVESCLAAAVGKTAFRASGQAFKMVYSYRIPTQAEPTPTQAEPTPTEVEPTPTEAQTVPVAAPEAASGSGSPSPAVVAPSYPITDEERPPEVAGGFKTGSTKNLEKRFRISRSLMILSFGCST